MGLEKAKLALNNPYLVLGKFYDFYFGQVHQHNGINFLDQEWDNLLMLDGCRYDLFREATDFSDDPPAVTSPASQTLEFLEKTIDGESFPETVYVTANPQISKIDAEFAEIVPLWDAEWDDESGTVLPSAVADAAISAYERHPNKRLWVHFVQPHIPFIGDAGKSIVQPRFQGGVLEDGEENQPGVWAQLARGDLDKETVWTAYRENLELVIPHVKSLIAELDGRSVITSDHGNGFGEWGIYGHDPNRHIDALTKVPWVTLGEGERETQPATRLDTSQEVGQGQTTDRLRSLGYL